MSDLQRWSIGIDEQGIFQRHDDTGHWVEYEQAADLIEQQQARIAELEAERDSVCHLNDSLSLERDQLAAAVERLRETGTKLRDDIELSKIVGAGKRNFANEWDDVISATPAANLNHVKREVAKEAFIAGFDKGRIKLPVVDLRTHNGLAEEYASQRYPVKDGE